MASTIVQLFAPNIIENIINEMDETKVDKDRAKKLPPCVRV